MPLMTLCLNFGVNMGTCMHNLLPTGKQSVSHMPEAHVHMSKKASGTPPRAQGLTACDGPVWEHQALLMQGILDAFCDTPSQDARMPETQVRMSKKVSRMPPCAQGH